MDLRHFDPYLLHGFFIVTLITLIFMELRRNIWKTPLDVGRYLPVLDEACGGPKSMAVDEELWMFGRRSNDASSKEAKRYTLISTYPMATDNARLFKVLPDMFSEAGLEILFLRSGKFSIDHSNIYRMRVVGAKEHKISGSKGSVLEHIRTLSASSMGAHISSAKKGFLRVTEISEIDYMADSENGSFEVSYEQEMFATFKWNEPRFRYMFAAKCEAGSYAGIYVFDLDDVLM